MKNPRTSEIISRADFSSCRMEQAEYEGVEFVQCTFPPVVTTHFIDCVFNNCNFSNSRFNGNMLQNVVFKDCKLTGTNFTGARDFGLELHFIQCILDYSSFDRKKLGQGTITGCRAQGANFTQADLSKCRLADNDFLDAVFDGTNLSGTDLSTCRNFIIDPEKNNIRKARFELAGLPGLLQKYQIIVS